MPHRLIYGPCRWHDPRGCQRVVGPLAEFAGRSTSIGNASQDSRSLISPALQLGKHSGSVFGWRAWAGSGGIRGGSTGSGSKCGDMLLQPATSSVSQCSVSAGLSDFLFGSINDLSLSFTPLRFSRTKSFHLASCGLLHSTAFSRTITLLDSQGSASLFQVHRHH